MAALEAEPAVKEVRSLAGFKRGGYTSKMKKSKRTKKRRK